MLPIAFSNIAREYVIACACSARASGEGPPAIACGCAKHKKTDISDYSANLEMAHALA